MHFIPLVGTSHVTAAIASVLPDSGRMAHVVPELQSCSSQSPPLIHLCTFQDWIVLGGNCQLGCLGQTHKLPALLYIGVLLSIMMGEKSKWYWCDQHNYILLQNFSQSHDLITWLASTAQKLDEVLQEISWAGGYGKSYGKCKNGVPISRFHSHLLAAQFRCWHDLKLHNSGIQVQKEFQVNMVPLCEAHGCQKSN